MKTGELKDIMAAGPIFKGMSADELEPLAEKCRRMDMDKDHVIFESGDEGTSLSVILSGAVRLTIPCGDMSLGAVGPGKVFGEISFFDPGRRLTGAVATTDVTFFTLKKEAFLELLNKQDTGALRLLRYMSELMAERLSDLHDRMERAARKLKRATGASASDKKGEQEKSEGILQGILNKLKL